MDGGKTRSLDIVVMAYMCRTVLGHGPGTHGEELDIAGLCRCPEIEKGEDHAVLSNTLHVDTGLDRPEQTGLNCVTGACGVAFDVTGDNSDMDSIAELEYNTWNDACAWEYRSASGNSPPGLIQNLLTEIISSMGDTRCYTDDDESPGEFGHGGDM